MQNLKHPNLIGLIEVFRRKKKLHFVFELCEQTVLKVIEASPKGYLFVMASSAQCYETLFAVYTTVKNHGKISTAFDFDQRQFLLTNLALHEHWPALEACVKMKSIFTSASKISILR